MPGGKLFLGDLTVSRLVLGPVRAWPLTELDWRMTDNVRNEKIKENVFTHLHLTDDVEEFL